MTELPSVSVIVAARNAVTSISDQVRAIGAQRYDAPWELIVVDDASTDDTRPVADAEAVAARLNTYRSIRHQTRQGQATARNAGASASTGDLLAFTDGDDLVHPGWISALADAAATADLVGGTIDDITLNRARVRRRRPPHPTNGLPLAFGSVPYALGTNLAIWRQHLAQLNGWTDGLYAGTDVDLCIRARCAGLELGHARYAIVAYRIPETRLDLLRQNFEWGRAERRLLRAHPELHQLTDAERLAGSARAILRNQDSAARLLAYAAGRSAPAILPGHRR